MELIRYKSIVDADFEEYEAPSDTVNHDATKYAPYDGPFNLEFAPYWVEHIESDCFYYYDVRYYEAGVVSTALAKYKRTNGSSLNGLLEFIAQHSDVQLIGCKASSSLLMREFENEGDYLVSHWSLATQSKDDYTILKLSHFPLRPEVMAEEQYEKYKESIMDLIREIDYMLVHAEIRNH